MVHAFRGHDAVIGWQIDDQISGLDFGSEARRAFHLWLHERFGQVESLNNTWGLELASQAYEYFEQIAIPPIEYLGQGPIPEAAQFHPSLMLAFQRFINDQWSSFVQIQCDMIRAGFDKPISTNMTANLGMNYFRQNHLLDRVSIDLDKIASRESAIIQFDRMRAEKPGTLYWQLAAPTDPALAWLSIFSGGELLLLNHWRQPWAGPEMNQKTLVTSTGRWSASKPAVTILAEQLKAQSEYLHDHPPVEARIAVVISNESAWAFSMNPPEPDFNYETIWRNEFHAPIAQSHYWRDVIDQTADFCPYHVIIMPLVPIVFRPTKERLKEWVTEGGCLLIGPLTGHHTEELTAWTDQEFGGLEDLIGATCTAIFSTSDTPETNIIWGTDPKPASTESDSPSVSSVLAEAERKLAEAKAAQGIPAAAPQLPLSTPIGQCHAFTPTTAHVLARYQTTGTRQDAAILMNKVGQGTVITLGARVDRESYLDLIHTLCELAKIETLAAGSSEVAIIPRMNPDNTVAAYGVVNLIAQTQSITLPKPGTDRLTNRPIGVDVTLQANEVLLLEIAADTNPSL